MESVAESRGMRSHAQPIGSIDIHYLSSIRSHKLANIRPIRAQAGIHRMIRTNPPNPFSLYQLCQVITGIDARQFGRAGSTRR